MLQQALYKQTVLRSQHLPRTTYTIVSPELSGSRNLERFGNFLQQRYGRLIAARTGGQELFHYQLKNEGDLIDLIGYSTGKMVVWTPASYTGSTRGKDFSEGLAALLEQSLRSLKASNPLQLGRAQELIDYSSNLKLGSDEERMTAIILCDTANEMILATHLRQLKVTGPPIYEGIPKKIETIERR